MKLPALAALALLVLPACLENEEEITIRPDGTCRVRVTAKGQSQDFAEGYPIPSGEEWKVVSADLPDYLLDLRTQMSSEDLRAWLPKEKDKQLEFVLAAEFPSVGAIPRTYAPVTDPYSTAYLARTSELRVERRGTRKLYTFERHYGAREYERFDAWSRMKRELPDELVQKIERADEHGLELGTEEFERVLATGVTALHQATLAHLDDALLAEYTFGRAQLAPSAAADIRAHAERALASQVDSFRLREVLALLCTPPKERQWARADAEQEAGAKLAAIEGELRAALRRAVSETTMFLDDRYAIQAQLEWSFTAFDQTNDLADETFTLRVHLPGTIVGGNFDKREDGAAVWEFKGETLQDREIVLRAVSIAE